MASPAAILSILIRAGTTTVTDALPRFNQQRDSTHKEPKPPMKASDTDRRPNRAERRKRARSRKAPVYGDAAIRAMMRHIDALQADPRPWRIHGSDLAESPCDTPQDMMEGGPRVVPGV